MHGQKNNGYSACTEYPLSRLPTPSDRCHNRNFWNYFLMSTRVTMGRQILFGSQCNNGVFVCCDLGGDKSCNDGKSHAY